MIQLIKAVVLNSFKFKDTSLICHTYSREHGLISVLVSGLGKSKSLNSQIYFQPLSVIEFDINYKEKKGLTRATNIRLVFSPVGLVPEVKKYAISFFISELLLRTCREKEEDKNLFNLLEYCINLFKTENYQDIHIYFLINYIELLGFSLRDLDFIEGRGVDSKFEITFNRIISEVLTSVEYKPLLLGRGERMMIINNIIHYLQIHTDLNRLKSLQILEDIFS